MHVPELLAPAGGMRQLCAALRFGADAVYVGLERYSLRAHAGNFSPVALREAVRVTHAAGKKIYLTLNILPNDAQMEGLLESAQFARDIEVDGAIVTDPGVVAMLRDEVPDLRLHLSTQANTLNTRSALFWHQQGVQRIILARELSLDQISAMRRDLPETLALEVFVHGAVCMSFSGRCLLSAALTGRSANQGSCTQPCRWQYELREVSGKHPTLPIQEDAQGTTVLSAHDLCMVKHLPALCRAGVTSLKIEGRMKGEYYVAAVVRAYRQALEACREDAEAYTQGTLGQELVDDLYKTSHRSYDTGFFFGPPERPGLAGGYTQNAEYVGYVLEVLPNGQARIEVKNRFFVGDLLEALTPVGVYSHRVKAIQLDESGEFVASVSQPLTMVRMEVPSWVEAGDMLRGPCRNHISGSNAECINDA